MYVPDNVRLTSLWWVLSDVSIPIKTQGWSWYNWHTVIAMSMRNLTPYTVKMPLKIRLKISSFKSLIGPMKCYLANRKIGAIQHFLMNLKKLTARPKPMWALAVIIFKWLDYTVWGITKNYTVFVFWTVKFKGLLLHLLNSLSATAGPSGFLVLWRIWRPVVCRQWRGWIP